MTGQAGTLVRTVRMQHRQILGILSQCERASRQLDKVNLSAGLSVLLDSHLCMEERLLLPGLLRANGGERLAEELLKDHFELRLNSDQLKVLFGERNSQAFLLKLKELKRFLVFHIEHMEKELMPFSARLSAKRGH